VKLTLMKKLAGITLIELMIALVIGSVVAVSVISAFSMQSSMTLKQSGRTLATEEGREVFTVISALIKQAHTSTITITQTVTSSNISFMLNEGAAIWPNDDTPPYLNNWIRVSWTSQGTSPNQITIARAPDEASLATAVPVPLAGDPSGKNTKITMMELIDPATGVKPTGPITQGLLYKLEVEAGSRYNSVPVKTSFEGLILPRN